LKGQPLTNRESQVCGLLSLGKGNKEIAWDLKLSPGTIKQYLSIFVKLDCHNRTEVALRTIQDRVSFGPFRQGLFRRDGGARNPASLAIITPLPDALRLSLRTKTVVG
jgi:DNA-binding CsgD family transcriptional regulator